MGYRKVSILNPVFNSAFHVIKTFESLNCQTFKDFELITIDDGSEDECFSIISEWLNDNANFPFKILRNNINIGISKSLNRAISISSGEFIAILGDDIWKDTFLEQMVSLIESQEENVGLVYSCADVFNTKTNKIIRKLDPIQNAYDLNYPKLNQLYFPIGPKTYLLKRQIVSDYLFWINDLIAFTVIIRRKLINQVGGYPERYWIEDYPMWFKLSQITDFVYLDKVLATYIIHGENVSIKNKEFINEMVILLLKDNFKLILDIDTKKITCKRIIDMQFDTTIYKNITFKRFIHFLFSLLPLSPMLFTKAFINHLRDRFWLQKNRF